MHLGSASKISVENLEPRTLLTGAISEQIIVDQFGWRADAASKVAMFADPINGQNSAVSYTPGGQFQVRRTSDDGVVFTGNTAQWNGGATDSVSGDKVWSGDFSSLNTPGEYYIYDPTNNLRSYAFKLDNNIDNSLLTVATRMYYYQRTGIALTAQYAGNWTHAADHLGPGQDTQAILWQNGAPVAGSMVRDVSGGWFDAGDFNKYVPFTTSTIWELLSAYEWNPTSFGDANNIPESGNGVPDELDETKYELDWLLKMQTADGSVLNRAAKATYDDGDHDPSTDTLPRYYTQSTTWATASFAASAAHASRVFAAFDNVYPGYSAKLLTAAQNAWNYLSNHTSMFPANGSDGGSGLAAADASGNAGYDLRLRILAAAELYKTTGNATYKTYFDANYNNAAAAENGFMPLTGDWPHVDPSLASDLNRAYVTYATTNGATAAIVAKIKNGFANFVDSQIVGTYTNGDDPYRAYMYTGHYTWGSNALKGEWATLLIDAIKINVNPANNAMYKQVAEEYLHYIQGRNPLSEVYLTNMGTKGANLGGDKSVMQPYHGWFGDGSPLYDGENSTYGPPPGYLIGGANGQFDVSWVAPPYGQPPEKSFKDWNTGWNDAHQANEDSWEVTEPDLAYQAPYVLLLSVFATPAATVGSIGGNVWNDPNSNGIKDAGETALAGAILYLDTNNNGSKDAGEVSTTTDASGNYTFANLAAGTYHVKQQLPSGYRKTLPESTGVPGYDVVVSGSAVTGKNFGDTTNILLGGKVFNDANPIGIAGVTVNIISNGSIVATRTTDANGVWQVKGLSAGSGSAEVVLPSGYALVNPSNGKYIGSMTSGQANANLNFSLQVSAPPPMTSVDAILQSDFRRLDFFAE